MDLSLDDVDDSLSISEDGVTEADFRMNMSQLEKDPNLYDARLVVISYLWQTGQKDKCREQRTLLYKQYPLAEGM